MMMNCFCGMVDQWKMFSLISNQDQFQRYSPSQISDTPQTGFEPVQNLILGFTEWSCAVVITITLWHHGVMEFQVRYLALFLLFSVIENFKWFCMGSLHKNIELMLNFLKAPFLVLHFSYHTLTTFLMMLSVILLFMLIIVLPNQSLSRHLICGNN